jgi:hypothetical protein
MRPAGGREDDWLRARALTLVREAGRAGRGWLKSLAAFKNAVIKGVPGVTEIVQQQQQPCVFRAYYKRNLPSTKDSVAIARRLAATPCVIPRWIIPDDVRVAEALFGIEAGFSVIVRELDDAYKSLLRHHFRLVADCMTHFGSVRGINNMGLIPVETNVMHYASSQPTMRTFLSAAFEGHIEATSNTSARIMMGLPISSQEDREEVQTRRTSAWAPTPEEMAELFQELRQLGLIPLSRVAEAVPI